MSKYTHELQQLEVKPGFLDKRTYMYHVFNQNHYARVETPDLFPKAYYMPYNCQILD